MSQDELYHDTLLDHFRRPRNKRALPPDAVRVEMDNPLCGDRLALGFELEGDGLRRVAFDGSCCAICTASASMMTGAVEGLSAHEATALGRRFIDALQGDRPLDASFGECAAFEGVRAFPLRVKCASLPWRALERALREGR